MGQAVIGIVEGDGAGEERGVASINPDQKRLHRLDLLLRTNPRSQSVVGRGVHITLHGKRYSSEDSIHVGVTA